jgi:hypothetical protein
MTNLATAVNAWCRNAQQPLSDHSILFLYQIKQLTNQEDLL